MADVKESCDDSNIDVPNSSGSKDLVKTLPEEAFNNFLQGKRHMLVQDYSFAVQSLATACELYVKHFGELAIECGEVYFLYGKALFRLSQQQGGVLGQALNEGSNEENSSESDKENESEKNSDAEGDEEEEEEENEGEEVEKEEKEPSESTDSPPVVVDEGSSESKTKVEKPESTSGAGTSQTEESENTTIEGQLTESKECEKEEESEENQNEEDDLELAWNTLETAKSIFKRQNTVEAQLKIADILLLLAEISMESDNNANAINDLKECLEIQKKHLKPDDRIIAETYYQMGLVLMLDKKYHQALENFRTTKHILELRKENLKNTPIDEADGTFASADIQAEISDLEGILVDIKEKIDDTEELINNIKKELEESSLALAGSSSISKEKDEKNTKKPVSNITHLLKRKKPEEGSTEENAKRLKTSGVFNGDSKVTAAKSSNPEG